MTFDQLRRHFVDYHCQRGIVGLSPLTGQDVDTKDPRDLEAAHSFDHDEHEWPERPAYVRPHIHVGEFVECPTCHARDYLHVVGCKELVS